MNRPLTSLFAAFEAVLVVAIGVGVLLAPLTLLWGTQYGFGPDWAVFWRASVDTWLVGHGVDIAVTLDSVTAKALGVGAAEATFALTIAVLGFALFTALMGVRAGRRIAETDHRLLGTVVTIGVFGVLSLLLGLSAVYPLVRPSLVQAALLPTLVYAIGVVLGSASVPVPDTDDTGSVVREWILGWPARTRSTADAIVRGAAAAVVAVLGASSVLLAVLLVTGYARIIALYESLHTEVLGGVLVTIAQLLLLPNLILYTASWLVGPGFALGQGSSVSALGTSLGPVPAIPVLGALPPGESAWGFAGLLVPLLAGFLAGALLHARLGRSEHPLRSADGLDWRRLAILAGGVGMLGGALLGLLSWAAAGSAGPGRLGVVGADPLAVGLWAAVELGVGAAIGLAASSVAPWSKRPDR